MNLQVEADVAAFADACARLFVERAGQAIAARGKFVVALTGGSTPGPIHRALATTYRDAVDWSRVTVLFGDDRAVPPTDERSNFRAANETLLAHVPATVFRIEGERTDLDRVARDYEQVLLQTCNGELDFLFVGLGQDAHVLSLWPGCPAIEERERLVVATIDPPMNPAVSRVTMTPPVVERAHLVLAIATGTAKRDALSKALHAGEDRPHIPAQILRRGRDVRWIVDAAAGAGS